MLARTMIEGGIENRGIRKLHRNLRVPSAACYSYTIPRNRHFRNWTSIMSFATRTNCISGGHTIPVWELPIVQDWHKSRFIVGNLYTQHPLVCFPQEANIQLGWVLYKRTIRLRPARTSSWLPNSPGQAPRDIPRLFNSWALFLYPIYRSSYVSTGAFQPPIAKPQCVWRGFRVDFISGMHLRISMTLMVYSSLSWCPTSSIGDWVFWIPFTM